MMGVGNRDIERIADDVGSRCDGKVDRRMATIDDDCLMGFDKNLLQSAKNAQCRQRYLNQQHRPLL
jgi:hypothetical protein